MTDKLLDKNITQAFVEVQKKELQVRYSEMQLREKNLETHKEIALYVADACAKDKEQEQQMLKTESIRQNFFIGALVLIFTIFAGFLVMQGHIGLLEELVTLAIFAFGGFGMAIICFTSKRNAD